MNMTELVQALVVPSVGANFSGNFKFKFKIYTDFATQLQ